MAEVTPTLPVTYGGGSPLSSSLSSSPSSLLTQDSLRNQCAIPSISDDDDIMLKPSSGSDPLLSNGHMISVLAFSKDTYMNVSVPCDVSINYQQQPSFLPWSRLALLIYVLQGRSKNFETKEKKPEIKIEVSDSFPSTKGDDKSNNPSTTTTEEAFTCTCYYGINDDDDDDDANSWSGFCLKCEYSYGNNDIDYECQLDEEEEEEESEEEEEEEEEYNEQNLQDDDDDDGFIVQFACASVSLSSSDPVVPRMCLLAPPPPPLLQHVSSFSSDESGFCERSNFDSSSNGEDEDEEEEEKESACVFDEGLWQEFEEQACFSGTNSFFRPCPLSSPIDPINSDSGSEVTLVEDIDLPPPAHHHLKDHEEDTVADEESKDQTLESSSCKRVRFKPEPHLFQVHHMVTWRQAYRMARKGHWEQLGLDRDRFQRRIETIGKAIGPCLLKKLEKMKLQCASNRDNDEAPVLVDVQ